MRGAWHWGWHSQPRAEPMAGTGKGELGGGVHSRGFKRWGGSDGAWGVDGGGVAQRGVRCGLKADSGAERLQCECQALGAIRVEPVAESDEGVSGERGGVSMGGSIERGASFGGSSGGEGSRGVK